MKFYVIRKVSGIPSLTLGTAFSLGTETNEFQRSTLEPKACFGCVA